MSPTAPRRLLATLVAIAAVLTGCSEGRTDHDAVFLSTHVREVDGDRCDRDTGLCVAVTAPVDGKATGAGSCRLFGPGDPDELEPLAESGPLELEPGAAVEWVVALPGAIDVRQLNPVCTPMIEG